VFLGIKLKTDWFVYPNNPWFKRSGIISLGLGAGVFTFKHANGNSWSDESFRVVFYTIFL
jgi:hypothetical protein